MDKNWRMIAAVSVLAGAFLMNGCDSEDESTYEVEVAWTVGGVPSCESTSLTYQPDYLLDPTITNPADQKFIFDEMVIKVFEEKDDEEPIRNVSVDCDSLSYVISTLDRGEYYVTINALADYDGQRLAYFQSQGSITAPPPDGEDYNFPLSLGTGFVAVTWGFEKGVCGGNGVETLRVTLQGKKTGNEESFDKVSCDQLGGQAINDVEWDIYQVFLEGYDGSGILTHFAESEDEFKVRPGETKDVYVILKEVQTN